MLLIAAVAGAALGAGPAVGAKHRNARLVAKKARSYGHVPARSGRPPLVGTLPQPSTAPTTPTTTDPVPPTPSCPTAIGVTEGEYYTHPSRTTMCPGSILMELKNAGEDDHDLRVLDLDRGTVVATWEIAHPGDAVRQRVTLPSGRYRLYCSLSDGKGAHETLGMYAVITVG